MKRVSRLLGLLLLLVLIACAAQERVVVERVIDGDTIVLQGGERVRYIGIDAPEIGERWGEEAKVANARLVAGKRVRLERDISDRDRYGRLLRYVYINGVLVEGELVRLGLAEARAYPPDTRYRGRLEAWEEEAKRAGKGIWQKGGDDYLPLFWGQGFQEVFVFRLPVSVLCPLQGLERSG